MSEENNKEQGSENDQTDQITETPFINSDGTFDHPAEHLFIGVSQTVVAGANPLNFSVPPTASVGNTYARFRLSTSGGLLPTGPALDGEVEEGRVKDWMMGMEEDIAM